MEVRDIAQETGIKIIPRKRKAKKQNGCLRRPYKKLCKEKNQKAKEKKERYTHLNEEFQRIARRGRKTFLSNQCKEIEENNRMGKMAQRLKRLPAMRET